MDEDIIERAVSVFAGIIIGIIIIFLAILLTLYGSSLYLDIKLKYEALNILKENGSNITKEVLEILKKL